MSARRPLRGRTAAAILCAGVALATIPRVLSAQWSTTFEQHYFADRSNWAFRNTYPAADRLFNAFDYGHAILYERLYTRPHDDPSALENDEYDFITKKLLVKPPRLPLEEAAIEVEYAKLVPEAKQMFDWAHVLHRQVYDVLADERVPQTQKDARIARVLAYYKSRPDLAFSSVPKTMDLMEGEYYGLAFRQRYPKFNGLIWAHVLHRQVYDVLADERVPQTQKDARIARVLAYYKSRPDLAFSSVPKTMELMEGEYYGLAFRQRYPKFNGLIWAYHWLQIGLYEPLLAADGRDARRAGVRATTQRFFQMLENAPQHMPRVMPMTPAVAPRFTARYPEIATIFDNLHGMHDVVSDILASGRVPRDRKRAAILEAAARYRDSTSSVWSRKEWVEMADMMGSNNMGGPAVGFTPEFPAPSAERGATMAEIMKAMGHDTAPAEPK